MEYRLSPPLCAETARQCMRMGASLELTRGDAALTPTAVQWVLSVDVRANGRVIAFDFVENLLRCFVAGAFVARWAADIEPPMYEQERSGFCVTFARGSTFPPATAGRRQVTALRVAFEFAYNANAGANADDANADDAGADGAGADGAGAADADTDALFGDTLRLADYGFSVLMRSVAAIAPAVFTAEYGRIAALQPLFRPLKLALGLPRESFVLEQIAERAVVAAPLRTHDAPPPPPPPRPRARRRARQRTRLAADLASIDPVLALDALDALDAPRAETSIAAACVWCAPGEFFRRTPFQSRRFVVLTGETDEVHECVFLSQLLKQA